MDGLPIEIVLIIAEKLLRSDFINFSIAVPALRKNRHRIHLNDPEFDIYKDSCGNLYCSRCKTARLKDLTSW